MPIYTYECTVETCAHLFEEFHPMSEWELKPPCPKCEGSTVRAYVPSGLSSNPDPVIVFKAPDGTFRYPGDPSGLSAAHYETMGYDRVELRGWPAVRRFEKTANTHQASEIARRVERQLEIKEASDKARRSEVYNGLRNGFAIPELDERGRPTGRMKTVRMSSYGADIMRAAMDQNDRKPRPATFDPGFHSDAYANTRSNRDESRRPDGKKFRD